jgi:hypothetical protein
MFALLQTAVVVVTLSGLVLATPAPTKTTPLSKRADVIDATCGPRRHPGFFFADTCRSI